MSRTGGPEPELVIPRLTAGAPPTNVLSPEYQAYQRNLRAVNHGNLVGKHLKGLHASLNPYRDTAIRIGGKTISVLARQSADGLAIDSQWFVTITGDGKPSIAAGSLIFPSITDMTPMTVTNYDAEDGWTASTTPTDGQVVCFRLTLDANVDIGQVRLDLRHPGLGLYTTTGLPAYIQYLYLPIALIEVDGDTVSVKAQFVTGPVRLRFARWDLLLGYLFV